MARKKTKLAYITNDATRRITLRKRRHGLLKKVYELSVLCNVPSCAIIYSPQETDPVVWPSTGEARELLNQFNATEGLSKETNMMNQEKFLLKQIVKLRGQLSRIMAENDDLSGEILLLECMAGRSVCDLGIYELGLVGRVVGRRIEAVDARILMLRSSEVETQALPLLLPAPAMEEMVVGGVDGWTDGVLGWEEGLFSGCANLFQPDLGG
ncbi:hypothetical protein M5K25_011706 [Dendrobium thyrsiflorum]|uniref:MADS-box domain-containing protein n=1 Tax=Dendrobium thyrsiflorum TaxID=117978 RepID=A0ABD0VAG2_DENTH